ncbi:hypothetical protein [Marilutibacter spongiae]|uniref:Minor tail T domain-containing protein n=1 Tax=Marilutibacter spongiae TaxID=2025720 RepID=A0A7W3TLA7_9GAMM|nr:hypothetical protein [Lysobacter spongiae]MBB1060430.1 hypothetical protein [Lysobacter spongiae]
MSPAELDVWREFFRLYPFDDHHRYHRPAALASASMGGDFQKKLDFLSPPVFGDQYSEADIATMRALGFDPSTRP